MPDSVEPVKFPLLSLSAATVALLLTIGIRLATPYSAYLTGNTLNSSLLAWYAAYGHKFIIPVGGTAVILTAILYLARAKYQSNSTVVYLFLLAASSAGALTGAMAIASVLVLDMVPLFFVTFPLGMLVVSILSSLAIKKRVNYLVPWWTIICVSILIATLLPIVNDAVTASAPVGKYREQAEDFVTIVAHREYTVGEGSVTINEIDIDKYNETVAQHREFWGENAIWPTSSQVHFDVVMGDRSEMIADDGGGYRFRFGGTVPWQYSSTTCGSSLPILRAPKILSPDFTKIAFECSDEAILFDSTKQKEHHIPFSNWDGQILRWASPTKLLIKSRETIQSSRIISIWIYDITSSEMRPVSKYSAAPYFIGSVSFDSKFAAAYDRGDGGDGIGPYILVADLNQPSEIVIRWPLPVASYVWDSVVWTRNNTLVVQTYNTTRSAEQFWEIAVPN